MAETQVTKVRLETLEQRVLLGLRVVLVMLVIRVTPATMVRQVMVVLLVQVTLVIRARLVTKLVVVAAAAAVLEGKETTVIVVFIALKTFLMFLVIPELQVTTVTPVMLEEPRRHLAVFLLAVLVVLAVTPRTADLIEHQMLVFRAMQVPQVILVVAVILVAETTVVQVTQAVLVVTVMQETLEQVRLLVARVTQELPETKELLATQETLVLTGMLVSIQPSVIL